MINAALVLALSTVLGFGGHGQTEWREYRSEAGRFSVLMPGMPQESAAKFVSGSSFSGTTGGRSVDTEEPEVAYSVRWADFPGAAPPPAGEVFRRRAMLGVLIDSTVRGEKDLVMGGWPGREEIEDYPDDGRSARSRKFLVGHRLFELLWSGPTGRESSPEAERFFESFRGSRPAPAGWLEFHSNAGRFSALFPGVPSTERRTAGSDGSLELFLFLVRSGDKAVYQITYTDVPNMAEADPQAVLNAGFSDFGSGGTVQGSEDFTQNGAPARDVVAKFGDGTFRVKRMVLVGDRVYQITTDIPGGPQSAEKIRTFTLSFVFAR
jgi:hypothetical protein